MEEVFEDGLEIIFQWLFSLSLVFLILFLLSQVLYPVS